MLKRSPWVVLAGLAVLTAVLVVWNPAGAAVILAALCVLMGVLGTRRRLSAMALGTLGLCLLGYALLGRGFAYLGVPPLYIGEAVLALGLLVLLIDGRVRALAPSPVVYALLGFMLIGLLTTAPYVGQYGMDALRDAVLWGYALFALVVAALLLRADGVMDAARGYVRFVPLFLLWMPVALIIYELYGRQLPRLPGTSIPVLDLKGGDVAVHLAGIAALLLLGLPALLARTDRYAHRLVRAEWWWWGLWLAAAVIPLFRVRAGLLAIGLAVLVLFFLRPGGQRWWKPLLLTVVVLTSLLTFNVRLTVGEARNTISAETLLLNLQSITKPTGEADRDGSRRWRLLWWSDIVNYTFDGPYFWTGKGYGINLADADGYQLGGGTLRSPHNGHLTILARSGVPGLAAWVLLQGIFALSLLAAYRRAARSGQVIWARLNLWVLAYWTAFMVNTSFDVYLEGPQGGIWFWSLFGFGIALLETQRRQRLARPAAQPQGVA